MTGVSRLLLVVGTGLLAAYGVVEMYGVLGSGGVTFLQWLFLVLFSISFARIAFTACQAALGFLRRLRADLRRQYRRDRAPLSFRTAILMPVYNEDATTVAAALAAMANGLTGHQPGRFDIFVLSDSNRPDNWITEEMVFAELISGADDGCSIYYRHRHQNTERKAGNIADWVRRWGGGYEAMLVLDADSLMEPETIIEMTRRLQADPGLGILQTLPSIVRGRSLYGRLQQFANRCYGPIFGNGFAAWHGRNSNFWGHNAIIRTAAFAGAAGLPLLSGKPPFGGAILSHDFIEAALIRRAGWGVRLDTDLPGSYEDAPPSLLDTLVRDRRWCQGNLQHSRFLFVCGLTAPSRLHLLSGIMSYLSAAVWFVLIIVGLVIAVQVAVTDPEYFAGPSLFPIWPTFDRERAIDLFIVSMAVVVAPKMFGWLSAIVNPRRMLRFGGPFALSGSVVLEIFLSALYAPIMMVAQTEIIRQLLTGKAGDWVPQRRGDGWVSFADAFRAHRWHVLVGGGMALLASQLNPDLFFWLLPITAGLILAAPLSWVSGSRRVGGLLQRLGLLRTPEEFSAGVPAILAAYRIRLDRYSVTPTPPLSRLVENSDFREWHLAQLSGDHGCFRGFDAAVILARAKAVLADDLDTLNSVLTPDEMMAFLNDVDLVTSLEGFASSSPGRPYALNAVRH